MKDLHVHELTFYSCDPSSHDYDPRLGHNHICWKRDLSVFEEHEFSSPYTGSDGKSYVSCQQCHYTMPVDTGRFAYAFLQTPFRNNHQEGGSCINQIS
ncbi:MAG: hypothetical protein PUA93_07020 [Eubacteriales bacterium]|nr:hypothetical protein [Eubacteriales bacterium]